MRSGTGTAPPADPELVDLLPCGVVSWDDDGIVLRANETLVRRLGYTRAEVEGKHVEQLLTLSGKIFFQTHLYPLVRLHHVAREIFVLLRHKDGSDAGALINVRRRDPADDRSPMDCALMEVRERRKFEDALINAKQDAEEANRAKSQFLAVMSHELRTPLNAIGGYVQLIELGIHGPVTDPQRNALERIGRAQKHLLGLINNVLNLARIESGRVEYGMEDVPVGPAVAAVLPMLEPQMRAGGLTARTDVADGLVVRADREKLQQILINLLTNAVKFTPAGGSITMAARRTDDDARVAISVTDTGIGIPASKLASVFEPFVQVDASRTRTGEGSGLGLAISRDLARGMGGDLVGESEVGKGSRFSVVLPIAETGVSVQTLAS
jgi:PAS domain S-box-containing protein